MKQIRNKIEAIFKSYPDIKIGEYKFLIDDLEELFSIKIINIPDDWRKGQFAFDFLEFLRVKGVPTGQNARLADTFHISDKEWDKYLEEFRNQIL